MLPLSAEVPMFYMSPATFQSSQTASHWHYQVHCSASALRSYSHCLSPSKNGCDLGKHSQAAIWDSPRKQARQGFKTYTPGKAEVWAQQVILPSEDEHHTAQLAAPMTDNLCLQSSSKTTPLKMHGPTSSPQTYFTSFTGCVLPWNKDSKLIQQLSFATCLDNFCHNRVPFPCYSQQMKI